VIKIVSRITSTVRSVIREGIKYSVLAIVWAPIIAQAVTLSLYPKYPFAVYILILMIGSFLAGYMIEKPKAVVPVWFVSNVLGNISTFACFIFPALSLTGPEREAVIEAVSSWVVANILHLSRFPIWFLSLLIGLVGSLIGGE